jgi:AraC family transcriptional regulator
LDLRVGERNLERRAPAAAVELRASPYRGAVEHVIREVLDRLDERLPLEKLAALVHFSPYHFHRIFRRVTGLPPGRFFGAHRIEAAKRLLLTSNLTVSEVCLEVGYRSVGTFASQFSRLVGFSPRAFRELALADDSFAAAGLEPPTPSPGSQVAVKGRLELDRGTRERLVAIGLFRVPLAAGPPVARAVAAAPGRYEVRVDRSGSFHVVAFSVEPAADRRALLLHGCDLRVAKSRGAVPLRAGAPPGEIDLVLRPRRLVDPPILVPPVLLVAPSAQADHAA